MKAVCKHCGIEFEKSVGHLNRANKEGRPVFCTMEHFRLSRRIERSDEEKKAIKAAYDKVYHKTEKRKASARKYNATPAGRAMQKRQRDKNKQSHLEYCRTPEYRARKVKYDQEHRSKKLYGEFWESAILLEEIDKHITAVADKHNLRIINGTFNKSIRRKRQWLRLLKNLPQLT